MPVNTIEYAQSVSGMLTEELDRSSIDWLDTAIAEISDINNMPQKLEQLSAVAKRNVKLANLQDSAFTGAKKLIVLDAQNIQYGIPVDSWDVGEAVRILFYLTTANNFPDKLESFLKDLYRWGDEEERCAVIKALPLLPKSDALHHVALEAGRINSLRLFKSLAHNNPYPALYFDNQLFNQLVLKSLFHNLDVRLVVGLGNRENSELSRMCEDYVQERINAEREIPYSIWITIAPFISDAGSVLLKKYLADSDVLHRRFCIYAFERMSDQYKPEFSELFTKQLENETDEANLSLLRNILGK